MSYFLEGKGKGKGRELEKANINFLIFPAGQVSSAKNTVASQCVSCGTL